MNGYKTLISAGLSVVYGIGGFALGFHDVGTMVSFLIAGGGLLGLGGKLEKILVAMGEAAKGSSAKTIPVLLAILLATSACAPLKTVTDKLDIPMDEVVLGAQTAAEGADWFVVVLGAVFEEGCQTGRFKDSQCKIWREIEASTNAAVALVRAAAATYQQSGTDLSKDQVKAAVKELAKLALKLDQIYKAPDSVQEIANKPAAS